MKHTGQLTFCVIDCQGTCLVPGTILSCNVVATRGFSSVIKSKQASRKKVWNVKLK